MNNTCCMFTYRWSRTVGWPAGQQLRWLSQRHISSCSTWTASLAWRLSGKRCFWVAGEGEENTPSPKLEDNQEMSYWREGWSLTMSWIRNAWKTRERNDYIGRKTWRKCSFYSSILMLKVLKNLWESKHGADPPIYQSFQMTGSHMCKRLSNFSVRWTLPAIWVWTPLNWLCLHFSPFQSKVSF